MPTYQYECAACGHRLEVMQSMTDQRLKQCPVCQKDSLHRLIGTGGGIIFKGSGFYATDYKNKGCSAAETCPAAKPGSGCGCSGHCDHGSSNTN